MEIPVSRRRAMALVGSGLVLGCAAPAIPVSPTRFGVNAYELFLSGLPRDRAFGTELLATLARLDIPFVRFPASAQWAGDWTRYEEDPARYWSGLDLLFSAAEHHGIQLVPTIFWHAVALAFHLGEPMQAWLDPKSRTGEFARRYTETFVDRYDRSPALMMYEFANEANLHIDDPKRLAVWPKRDPTMPNRTPSARDLLTSASLRTVTAYFAENVRRHSKKPISAGTAVPRGNQWHLARGSRDRDTRDQFIAHFRAITPPAVNVLSCHLYDMLWPWPKAPDSIPGILAAFADAAQSDGRLSFLGEFGVSRQIDRAAEEQAFKMFLEQIRTSRIACAAVWNVSSRSFQQDWDIIPNGERHYQLDMLRSANRGA